MSARQVQLASAATFQSDIDGDGTCQFFCPFEFFRWKKEARRGGFFNCKREIETHFKGPHHLPDPLHNGFEIFL